MYASPVLSNAPKGKWLEDPEKNGAHYWHRNIFIPEEKVYGLPISCFAAQIPDTAKGQVEFLQELATLSMAGGGMGAHNSIRGTTNKAPGPIPYMKVVDAGIGYFRQGKTRRGAVAVYMDVDHPDILEHIRFRVPGGDSKRRSDNRQQFHSAINLTDNFIAAVKADLTYDLVCPHSGKVYDTLHARTVWEDILETRALTGEPYLMKIDLANRKMPESQKKLGLKVLGSNLCSEITLPTDEQRTFVCCLSSLNLEKYEEWKDTTIVQDLVRFLDNVLQYFIDNAPDTLGKSKYSAERERALGLGTLGWHSLLQSKNIPFEGGGFNSAVQLTHQVYSLIKSRGKAESQKLAIERGEAPDMIGTGLRNSRLTAVAPNSNSADIANSSPSIEPWYRNIFVKDTRAGSFVLKNKYLEALLETKGLNTKATWSDILEHGGSVQHLDSLTAEEKAVFKTAVELDQHWLIELANERGGYICQAQSLNVFFQAGMSRKYINSVHLKFLNSDEVITMYYFRTEREGKIDHAKEIERKALVDWSDKGEECVACQG
jgi:ribonucleoside-diphosphate reductase alpha chain